MNRLCEVPLDSYRLSQYTLQAPCYVCGGPNTHDSEYCRTCQAPMALAHHSYSQKIQPRMVAILGASGVGKTVYLGMLMEMLSRPSASLQALARGAYSITLQQMTTAALAQCEFPDKTPNEPDRWNWIHSLVTGPRLKRGLEVVMPDMAGEALAAEIDHPQTYPVIHALLDKCQGALLLVDAAQLQEMRQKQEHFALKLLTFLGELDARKNKGWTNRPIAVVLTKADQAEECFDDPAGFLQQHAGGVWQDARRRFKQLDFFAAGVAGACAYRHVLGENRRRVPLRIEPRGIREPFEWVLGRLK